MKTLSLGYSPCPNDTFIFYAMVHGRINTNGLLFNEALLDVETLNRKALSSELDISKISYHAFGHLREQYQLLHAGSALGRGCGPLLITKKAISFEELHHKKIAIPGSLTTAFLLFQLYYRSLFTPDSGLQALDSACIPMRFDTIIDAVSREEADAGLIIHESRFTYQSYGLKQVIDLGEWWEHETGLPIPLGGIIAKRSLGTEIIQMVDTALKRSVQYAFRHRPETLDYIKQHSRELSDEIINQHIDLYVNTFSIDLGEEGEKAVTELLSRAEAAGIIPASNQPVFNN